jgi:UTP--glucose-1-phosphate uridylyltransferase
VPVTKGVIAAAGSATRMWPGSKVFPKELFPLGRVPAILYVIWEMAAAGIDDIVIVGRKDNRESLARLLDATAETPANVRDEPVTHRFEQVLRTCKFTLILQDGPYGNGTPLLNAYPHVNADACVYAFADDMVFGENASRSLLETYQTAQTVVMAAQPVSESDVSKFGIVETTRRGGTHFISRLVEKPAPHETTSRLATLGRYVVTRELVDVLTNTSIGRANELWLTDAIIHLMKSGRSVAARTISEGQWFTIGHPHGYRAALLAAMRLEEAGFWD